MPVCRTRRHYYASDNPNTLARSGAVTSPPPRASHFGPCRMTAGPSPTCSSRPGKLCSPPSWPSARSSVCRLASGSLQQITSGCYTKLWSVFEHAQPRVACITKKATGFPRLVAVIYTSNFNPAVFVFYVHYTLTNLTQSVLLMKHFLILLDSQAISFFSFLTTMLHPLLTMLCPQFFLMQTAVLTLISHP